MASSRGLVRSAVFALLAVGLLATPARAAAPQDLSGEWLNSSYTVSNYHLRASADGKTLTAAWGADVGGLHEGLVGTFTGTLNQSGTVYAGSMRVTEGSLVVGGTMTVAIGSQQRTGYPLLTVSYQQDNGVGGTFTLEIWLLAPKLSPGPSPAATFEFYCPASLLCHAEAQAQARGAKPRLVGSVRFTIRPGHARKVRLSLNKTGRTLLAKRGSLRVQVLVVALTTSPSLPRLTKLGTIALHKK